MRSAINRPLAPRCTAYGESTLREHLMRPLLLLTLLLLSPLACAELAETDWLTLLPA